MIWWPGGLQLTFFISALISNIQATVFRSGWFRKIVGIQPLPSPAAPKAQSQKNPGTMSRYQAPSSNASAPDSPKGIFGNVKGAVTELMKLGEKYSPLSRQQASKDRLTAAEKKHAKAYEDRRTREIAREAERDRRSSQAKFEEQQELETREQERKERLQRRAEKKAKQRR